MRFREGFLTIGWFRRAPVRIHWSTPIGAFVLCGCQLLPGAWMGFLLLVLCHELGHAVLVRHYGHDVVGIDIHALGGACRWSGVPTERQRAVIAWGGVLAQAVLLVVGIAISRWTGGMRPLFQQAAATLIDTNIALALLNLVPIRPLDGAEAWSLFRWRFVRGTGAGLRGIWTKVRLRLRRRTARSATPLTYALLDELERRKRH